MLQVNIHAAKTTLSKLVAGVEESGESVALCRAGKPAALITPLPPKPRKLVTGALHGQIWIADDFDAPIGPVFGLAEGA